MNGDDAQMSENNKLEIDFSQNQLDDILHKHGCFGTAIRRLRYHINRYGYTVFSPSLPKSVTIEDLKTIVDLAITVGFTKLIIHGKRDYKLLNRRTIICSGNVLSVICDGD